MRAGESWAMRVAALDSLGMAPIKRPDFPSWVLILKPRTICWFFHHLRLPPSNFYRFTYYYVGRQHLQF